MNFCKHKNHKKEPKKDKLKLNMLLL